MNWLESPAHSRWLEAEGDRLADFAKASLNRDGGFSWLDERGRPDTSRPVELWITCRMTHVFALAHMAGRPGFGQLADHGVSSLNGAFLDSAHGGWFASIKEGEVVDDSKQAYAHAFVVLASASATAAGRPGAAELLEHALQVLDDRFFDADAGMSVDVYSRDFGDLEEYRGINANMHTTEALLAAADVTGNRVWLDRAAGILEKAIHVFAAGNEWRLPEHFDTQWNPILDYNRDEPAHPFRPFGATVGHWLEWARLALHARASLEKLDQRAPDWMLSDAKALFSASEAEGWAVDGADGFVYTVDWSGKPVVHDRMHWVPAEAVGAAAALYKATGDEHYAERYAQWWNHLARDFFDPGLGSWHHELDRDNQPAGTVWPGKPDAYHAYQATLIPRLPLAPAMAAALRDGLLS